MPDLSLTACRIQRLSALCSGCAGLACSVFLLIAGCSHIGQGEPVFGTPEAAAREAISAELGIPVSLEIDTSMAQGDWVFLAGRPMTPQGKPIDYSRTPYAGDVAEGVFDDHFIALIRQASRAGGAWAVVELSVGQTDAPFIDWPDRYGVPKSLVMPGLISD